MSHCSVSTARANGPWKGLQKLCRTKSNLSGISSLLALSLEDSEPIGRRFFPLFFFCLPVFAPNCGANAFCSGRSMAFGEIENSAYDHLDARKLADSRNGKQAGDPVKGAAAMYKLAVMEDPPLRCIIGTDAFKLINGKLQTYKENIEKHKELSNSTDVDGYVAPS